MTSDEVHAAITAALHEEWGAFAANHPRLASAIDQTVWIESTVESLTGDAEFKAAMDAAAALGTELEKVPDMIRDFVHGWLKRAA